MLRRSLAIAFLVLAACGRSEKSGSLSQLQGEPVSVRGWIADVAGAKRGATMEMEIARRAELFQATSLWVENFEFASGGISGNGGFVVLDVPPQNSTISFSAPGAETAKLVLQNVPGNADVFIPDLVLEPGGVKVLDPSRILVRVPTTSDKAAPTGRTAIIAGYTVPIYETPMKQFGDRREYPSPPGFRPVATVK